MKSPFVIAALVSVSAFAQDRFQIPTQQQNPYTQPLIFNPNNGEYRTDQGQQVYPQPGRIEPSRRY